MKKHKYLAIVLALVLIVSGIPTATLNADSIGKEAQACKELGILIGADTSGVTSSYLAQTPNRIQAFVIFLRLKGLDGEASTYQSTVNFSDANGASVAWAKNYMAYAKNKPELGWVGMPDGTFAPSKAIDAKAFYKVMLETLGYKQGVDFAYNDTLTFAEQVGLAKSASSLSSIKSFTVNDVAKGIYGALNTKPKSSDKKLITMMVEQNLIAADKALNAGFTLDTKPVNVVGFKNLANNKLELELDKEIVLQKGDIEISQLGGKSRLSILSVTSYKNTATILTTDATPFNAYEIKVNTLAPSNGLTIKDYSNKYVGLPKDTIKPTAKFEQAGSNEITVYFSEEVDKASAESLNNYSIEKDVTILGAHLEEDGKTVSLTTTDIYPNDPYRITVRNVKDISGNAMNQFQSHFDGLPRDNQGPNITKVESVSNSEILVTFNERLDSDSAENTGNYSIDNSISINSAKLDTNGKAVRLMTSTQSIGTIYKLVVQNVADTSDNYLQYKEYKFSSDSNKPGASVIALSDNTVQVTFTEKVNKAEAEDIDNYSADKGLGITKASLDGSGKIVTLVTSKQSAHELYTLSISGIPDVWGNEMGLYNGKFAGMPEDRRELSYTVASKDGGIVLTFNKRVDEASAENVFNYALDSDLGYAAKATLDDTGKIVTLLTAPQTSGKLYSITVSNVKDISGNRISSDEKICKRRFAGVSSDSSSVAGAVNLESVINIDLNTIDLIFDKDLSTDELDDMKVAIETDVNSNQSLPSGLTYYKYFLENKKIVRVQFKSSSSDNPKLFEAGEIYNARITSLDRLYSDNDANVKEFAGTGNVNEVPFVEEVSALNSTAVQVIFSEPVKGLTASQFKINNNVNINGVSVEGDEIVSKAVLYLSSSTALTDDKTYKLTVYSGIKDAAGLNSITTVSSSNMEFDGISDKNEAPYVASDITLLDNYTMQVEFSEPVKNITNSSFSVKRVTGSGSSQFIVSKVELSETKTVATVYFKESYSKFDSNYEYELSLSGSITDLQGLAIGTENRKVSFDGTDIELEELEIVASSIDADNQEITLFLNKDVNADSLVFSDFELSGAGYNASSSDSVECSENTIKLILKNELDSGETLTININDTGRAHIRDYNYQILSTDELEVETK